MMVGGFGLVGFAMRRRQRTTVSLIQHPLRGEGAADRKIGGVFVSAAHPTVARHTGR